MLRPYVYFDTFPTFIGGSYFATTNVSVRGVGSA